MATTRPSFAMEALMRPGIDHHPYRLATSGVSRLRFLSACTSATNDRNCISHHYGHSVVCIITKFISDVLDRVAFPLGFRSEIYSDK